MERVTDFRKILSSTLSRNFVDNIVESVHNYPEDFSILYKLIFLNEEKISWRAAWACEKLCCVHPEWFIDKQEELMNLAMVLTHSGTKRLILSIIYKLPVKEPISVVFLNTCMNWMISLDETVAIQALCLKLSYKFCLAEPELISELKVYLENTEYEYYSTAVRTTMKNILKELNKQKCFQKN